MAAATSSLRARPATYAGLFVVTLTTLMVRRLAARSPAAPVGGWRTRAPARGSAVPADAGAGAAGNGGGEDEDEVTGEPEPVRAGPGAD